MRGCDANYLMSQLAHDLNAISLLKSNVGDGDIWLCLDDCCDREPVPLCEADNYVRNGCGAAP